MLEPASRGEDPRAWCWKDTRLFAVLLGLFLFLRCYHLDRWLLANLDEIALLNNVGLPIFSGGYGSTSFFPAAQIARLFSPILPFPDLRYLGVAFHAAGLVFFYLAMLRLAGRLAALLAGLLYSLHWHLVYMSRICEVATLVPFFFSVSLYLLVAWRCRPSTWRLASAFFLSGAGAACYAPGITYATAALVSILALQALTKRRSWKDVAIASLAFAIGALPLVYVQLFVGDFFRDVLVNYQFAGSPSSSIIPIHFRNPVVFLRTWTELMTYQTLEHDWLKRLPVAFFALVATAVATIQCRKEKDVSFFGSWAFLTLAITFLSPVAAYVQNHFVGFLMVFFALLALIVARTRGFRRALISGACAATAGSSLLWMPIIAQDQWAAIAWLPEHVRNEKLEAVPISDGARLALQHTPHLDMPGVQFPTFTCDTPAHVSHGLSSLRQGRPALVIATFDCDIAGNLPAGIRVTREQRLTTLFDAPPTTQGIVFHFMGEEPNGGPN